MGKRHIRLPREIIEHGLIEFMNAAHFKVYSVLDLAKNKNSFNKNIPGEYYKTTLYRKTILKKTHLSKSSLSSALKDLEYWGLIRIESGKGRGRATNYHLFKVPKIKHPTKTQKQKDQTRILRKKRIIREEKGKFSKDPIKSKTYGERRPNNKAINEVQL